MTLSSQNYKGTRDFYPEDKRRQNYIFDMWRRVSERFGYEEYGAPILESLELYAAKSGQELVNEQTYTFTDRGGRTVAIRPEMTPTISRMVAAKRQELTYPARLFSIANFMRYERPQRGREREFWQLNVDIFGADGLNADLEMITLADKIMQEFGATRQDYTIRINERHLVKFVMDQYLGLSEEASAKLVKLFDRRSKIDKGTFDDQLRAIVDTDEAIDKVNALLDIGSIDTLPAELKDAKELEGVKYVLDELQQQGIDNAAFDITLMRGLDYYTGIVFEVFDNHPDNNRSLFGGGRYDGLVELFGVEPIVAVGFGMGGTTIENFLSVHDLWPELRPLTQVYVAVIDGANRQAAAIADKLRNSGINVELDVTGRKLDKQVKSASKKSMKYVLFVSSEDAAKDNFSIKNLETSEEQKMSIKDAIKFLKDSL